MPLIVPGQGQVFLLGLLAAEGYTLRLTTTDLTGLTRSQLHALTEADLTEATFPGYAAIPLAGGGWTVTEDDPTEATYPEQTFTRSSTGTAEVIRGYYLTRTAGPGALIWCEPLAGPLTVDTAGNTIEIAPMLTFGDSQEATVQARGVIAYQQLTSNSGGYTATSTTDHALSGVEVSATRMYRVHLLTIVNLTAAADWFVHLHVDGTQVARLASVELDAPGNDFVSSAVLWFPATGTYDLDIRVEEISSGSETLTLAAGATVPRQFWVEDAGPRPT